MVSTAVGGIPEVLPDDLIELAPCDPLALVEALARAISRVPFVQPLAQHERVSGFYQWPDVARETINVYTAAEDDVVEKVVVEEEEARRSNHHPNPDANLPTSSSSSMLSRLAKYEKCGVVAGRVFVAVVVVADMLVRWLEYWWPSTEIPLAPDIPVAARDIDLVGDEKKGR